MVVKTKLESIKTIKSMSLNHMPFILVNPSANESDDIVKKFFDDNLGQEFIVRNINSANAKYFFCNSFEEFKKQSSGTCELVQIVISFRREEGKLLLGDIKVSKGTVEFSATTKADGNHRNVYNEGINIKATLDDDKLWNIKGFDKVIDYVTTHNLYDVVVEFVLFDHRVGTNNENVLITELRSEY